MPKRMLRKETLSAAAVRLLGKKPDTMIAEQFEIPMLAIRTARRTRRIPPALRLEWTAEQIALLGTMSDDKVAAALGITRNSVFKRRRKLGVAPHGLNTAQARHKWTKAELAMLGRFSDAVVARRVGLDPATVHSKRMIEGIPSMGQTRPRPQRMLTKTEAALLGKLPDRVVAERIGMVRHAVEEQRRVRGIPAWDVKRKNETWTPERIARLGKISDADIALEMGIPAGTVSAFRLGRGIRIRKKKRHVWNAGDLARLGTVTDAVLANDLGITIDAVAARRNRLGISPMK